MNPVRNSGRCDPSTEGIYPVGQKTGVGKVSPRIDLLFQRVI